MQVSKGGDGGPTSFGTVFKISTNGTLTSLYSFGTVQDSNRDALDGANPLAGLVPGSGGIFYGTTSGGGNFGNGTVFAISTNGALTTLYSFTGGSDGEGPNGLVPGSDGSFYGTTQYGGGLVQGYAGTVFRLTVTLVLLEQPQSLVVAAGSSATFSVAAIGTAPLAYQWASNNVAVPGATNASFTLTNISLPASGSIFSVLVTNSYGGEFSSNAVLTVLPALATTLPASGLSATSAVLNDSITVASDDSVTWFEWGTDTTYGNIAGANIVPLDKGSSNVSTILSGLSGNLYHYRIDAANDFGIVYGGDQPFTVGFVPTATTLALVNSTNGSALNAIVNPNGWDTTVSFNLETPTSTISTPGMAIGAGVAPVHVSSFVSGLASLTPYSYQVVASNALGTTIGAAISWNPPLVRVSGSAGAGFTSLHSFFGNDGASPEAGLVQGTDGSFYGTTSAGGTYYVGTVFKIGANSVLTSLYSFGAVLDAYGNPLDGGNPVAGLVQGSDGSLYGTTQNGGQKDVGTVFRISGNGQLATLYSFSGRTDGANPRAGLVQGSDGNFYGTTEWSDPAGDGTVFQINSNGGLTTLYSFTGGFDGANPLAGLVQGSDGYFYGTTSDGGNNYGTTFKITANGKLTTLYYFGSIYNTNGDALDGAYPEAGLVQGSDGSFYGTTSGGNFYIGQFYGYGTVFEINTNGALTTLHSFTGGNDGANPQAALVQGSDGSFYGTTWGGGKYTNGTVFKISANGALTTLYSFTGGNDGANPCAALLQGSDGSFYGTTASGGLNGEGTVFRLTIMPEFQTMAVTNGTLSLTWSTQAGATYQLQCSSDLSSTNWINLSNAVTATKGTLSATDSLTNAPHRFYRLVLSP